MCQYVIPCHVCAGPVKVDQPDKSLIRIEIAYCLDCWKAMKSQDPSRVIHRARLRNDFLRDSGLSVYNTIAVRGLTQ